MSGGVRARRARARRLMREVAIAFAQLMHGPRQPRASIVEQRARSVLVPADGGDLDTRDPRRRRTSSAGEAPAGQHGLPCSIHGDRRLSDEPTAPDSLPSGAAERRPRSRGLGQRPRQALRRDRGRARDRLRGRPLARSSASSGPTAPASRPRSTCSARSCDPTGGSALVAGYDVVPERDAVRRNIGLVFQDTTLDSYLTAEQNLRLHAELYGVPRETVAPRMQQVLEMVGLWERRDSLGRHLLRRHEAAPGDRPRPAALPARAVPRRADRRPRPADAQLDLELHPRAQAARGHHDLPHHPLHGRGRVLRPHRDHGPGRIIVLDTPRR